MSRGAEHPETYALARAGICARACVRASPTERGALRERALGAAAGLDAIDPIPPRETWRVALIRAALAGATGDAFSFAQAAGAFDAAAALGIPELPLLCEPTIGEALLPVAVSAGSSAAREATRRAMAVSIRVLGGFEVRRGRALLELQPGKPEELVKILAAQGGRIATDEAVEELWPEIDEETGRRRLRNVLSRIRDGAGELVLREGESLAFPADAELDASRFETEARRALAAPPGDRPALARAAAARYRGELLPDDRYAGWAAAPRERLHRRHRALLDLLVADAESTADLDEALRLLERTIESDPYDEQPYLSACRLLLAQGRRAAAASMLARAGSVIEQLAVPVPPAFRDLEGRLSA
jgi:DNA-binding SARP family transcriptional activator